MQKIIPSLWFDKECEEAMQFYVDIFNGNPNKQQESKIISIKRYEEGMQTPGIEQMIGKVLTGIFELDGFRFMALDGGPIFKFNPSVSFHIKCKTTSEVDYFWNKIANGGEVLMPLDKYPFSEWYGWCSDKYGLSWQVIYTGNLPAERDIKQKITPALMFVGNVAGQAEEATKLYASVFENTKVDILARYEKGEEPDNAGTVKYASLTLFGQEFGAMDSAREHKFTFNEAVSFYVECENQAEVDDYWEKLSAVPESEVCGWLKDKYGVSWQIIPKKLGELLQDPDKEKANRVMNAMLKMKKIDIKALEQAYGK